MSTIGPIVQVPPSGPLGSGAEHAARQARPPTKLEPPISPPAVILPRTAAWMAQGEAAEEPQQPGQAPTSLLQTA